MAKQSVLLAVGHGITPEGREDPGATKGDWSEQRAMDLVIAACASALRAEGSLKVYDEAYKDDPNFVGTINNANRLNVTAVISGHQDWSGGLRQFFGFWYPGSDEGRRLTRTILAEYERGGFELNSSWTKARSDLSLLKRTAMPATLLEHGRVGDPWVDEPGKLENVGALMAAGILHYFGVPVKDGGPGVPVDKTIPDVPEPEPEPRRVHVPSYPLPRGHWYGVPARNPRNHSGYHWRADRPGIRRAQQRLRDRGWRISVDGYYGPQTEDVVTSFQREKGLTVDGLLGPQTWRALWAEPVT